MNYHHHTITENQIIINIYSKILMVNKSFRKSQSVMVSVLAKCFA